MEREVFLCPFCGAPQKDALSASDSEAKCKYCGSVMVAPRQLTGVARRCSNHPDDQSVRKCGKCGKFFCENCLHAVSRSYGPYACTSCLKKEKDFVRTVGTCMIPFGPLIIAYMLYMSSVMSPSLDVRPDYAVGFGLVLGLGCLLAGICVTTAPVGGATLADEMQPADFTYVSCPHCGAGYYYGSNRVKSRLTVICQNCNLPIDLRGVSHEM